MTEPTAKHQQEARESSGAVVRTRRIGQPKVAKRLPFTCLTCGGRWKFKRDAEECCKAAQCNRKADCPARSHYGDCRSMPYSGSVSGLANNCACQGGWICPSCAEVLRSRDEQNSATRLSSRDREIREVLEGLSSLRRYTHGQPERCWCDADDVETPHMPACLAARGLWERVRG